MHNKRYPLLLIYKLSQAFNMQAPDKKNPSQPNATNTEQALRQEILVLKQEIEIHKKTIHSHHVKVATKRGRLNALLARLDTS